WMDYEIFYPTSGEIKIREEEINEKEIPTMLVASIIHRGSFDDIEKSYNKLLKWIKKKGYKTSGPAIEIKIRYKLEILDEKGYLTEIQFPVEKEKR
ncbi:MAG: GyrI-like domain-containing protein, partial [bacterium]